ncbi:Eco57I restriction-modification methylase domain-containing protein [Sphingobacterium lumbrici]|uniref:Eco57I restriction-modification methylase domain-containing protein n=1 Tax=Sphingobacterium lumbrici TaxID=2559600 RepID=UPI00112D87C2|nr:TaqI-like C-terminal specificity domain-containing protein [Sphingobacterium lumbrici]
MTINEINKILAQLTENPSRENVLDFAFALLQWMNIEPNAQQKPQLLSPQTQKLKDFLAPAPQTVQPQLYRLSADNQNVRVRFAVLKKLKKDYISQLVDNDPGLSSYQSFIKGITANGSGFVPTQPYFIHFVTIPDYDKLVLIFNQGEQKRIVSFRRRLTTTQYNKIIQQWQGVGSKPKPEIADLLWKSLDIKEVNKEFYKQVKERFDALIGIVKTQHTAATENQVKQFTVRLIGRYIFCWFLKEKGIIAHSLIGKKTIEESDNYYQNVLLKLFFETLNTKVQDRNPITHNKLFEKIPYLNGGLFDESEEDKLFTDLQLDAWLLPFVEILESYDFTVDESSSQYQQVAVDPEMLGRIFENLLASQNEETEKLANQRKAFGAFYTPREIVDYMVNESIKAYLQTQWEQHIIEKKTKTLNNPEPVGDIFGNKKPQQLAIETKRYELKAEEKTKIEKTIEPLFAANPDAGQLKKEEKTLLLQFLEQIKILDPACGSGAFPMGILHKLVELHETLGTVKSPYELKKDILSQNIYGVDIMPMAIEIARLRAWLSLVLEENYNPKDPLHNFGVKPLPNLDFKFVCANSLIDLGLDAFIQDSKGTLHEGFTKKLVNQLKELENLRKQFFTPALGSSEKEQLKADYFAERDKVVAAIEADSDPVLKAIAQKIKHWNPFDDSQASPFFSPTWMFGIDKGFDIVIGNPPYVNISNLKPDNYREHLKSIFYSAKNKTDLYAFFIEAFTQHLKEKGNLIFIVPHTWKATDSFSKFRELLFTKAKVNTIVNLEMGVFEAIVKPLIIHLTKTIDNNYSINILNERFSKTSSIHIDEVLKNGSLSVDTTSNESQKNVFEAIEKNSIQLENFIQFSRGIKTSDDKRFVKQQKENADCKPVFRGKNIKAYKLNWNNEYVWYRPDLMKEKVGSVSYTKEFFEVKEKIVTQRVNSSSQLLVAYDNEQNYFLDTVNVSRYESWDKETSLKYLCGILNSKLINFWYCNKYKMPTIGIYELHTIPIRQTTKGTQKQIENIVDEILKRKKANQDTTALEREIDVLVYKLYELTYEEVKIIDKDFWLSEEEYGKVNVGEK